jgi:hypothetical protein
MQPNDTTNNRSARDDAVKALMTVARNQGVTNDRQACREPHHAAAWA